MKKVNHYKLEMRDNLKIKNTKKGKAKFKPIPIILTFGLLYHRFTRGKKIDLHFTHNIEEAKVKLIYMRSTSDVSLSSIHKILKALEAFCTANGVRKIETLVVNPFLSKKIMAKYGWIYLRPKMIIGKLYEKKIT